MTIILENQVITFWKILRIFVLCLCSFGVCSNQCLPLQAVPGIDQRTYSQPGDVNIGVFIAASQSSGPSTCQDTVLPGSLVIEYSEAVAYAVKSINENPSILRNITLGFIQINDCSNENVALAMALSFLPRINNNINQVTCSKNYSGIPGNLTDDCSKNLGLPFFDVVGAIGPGTSSKTLSVSKLLGSARIPIIGCLPTSDELSDKYRFPFFLRVIPPDKYQANAMIQFIKSNGWSYISAVYVKDSYGQKAFDNLKDLSLKLGICVATAHRVDDSSDFDVVVSNLLLFKRARVVVIFMGSQYSISLLTSVNKFNASGHFIWIWSDSWNTAFTKLPPDQTNNILGAFSVGLYSTYVREYIHYLKQIKVNNTTNPWFRSQWEYLAGCSLESNEACDPDFNILSSDKFGFEKTPSLYIDAVYAFAYAIEDLISDLCPNATGKDVRECIEGEALLQYLRNVSFEGYNGQIWFDEFGDRRGKYEVRQLVFDYKEIPEIGTSFTKGFVAQTVAVYDVDTNILSFTGRSLNWSYLIPMERLVSLSGNDPLLDVPESLCSGLCGPGQYKIQKDILCCWDCRKCRENEKVTMDGTNCEACHPLTWPDKKSGYTTCAPIPPTYPLITDTLPMILICLAVFALMCMSVVTFGYIRFRDSRVIKASSRELSVPQIVAIFVGYVTIIVFQTPPSHTTCGALYFLFCLSFALIYAPLLVKTVRIFRIFQSGKNNNKRPRLISPCSQLAVAGVLIGVQMLLCLIIYIEFTPAAKSTQPVNIEMFVELSCDMTSPGIASFLAYNLVLVFLCSLFAFKTRKLPDNFNESKFISMCVTTTLVIWFAFIPTYFTSSRNSARIMLISVALLLNHTVAFIFLFVPKVYAAVYLPTENFTTSRFQASVPTTVGYGYGVSNRVTTTMESRVFHPTIDAKEGVPKL